MEKKRAVFLFGAGAALDWGGPKTICNGSHLTFLPEYDNPEITKNRVCCLTHLIRETGYKATDGQRISEKIYQRLQRLNPRLTDVNFETVLDVMDELVTYAGDPSDSGLNSLLEFPNDLKDELFNYDLEKYPESNTYRLSVPGNEYGNQIFSNEIVPDQQFASWLFQDGFQGIVGHVSKYSYHTPTYNVIFKDVNQEKNELFCNWIKSLQNDYIIRMYSLNYERLFKLLLENKGLEIFEGFDMQAPNLEFFNKYPVDIRRILTDINSNSFYNLHGCVNWSIDSVNDNQLPGYQYWLTDAPNMGKESAMIEIEKGRQFVLTNIISGYRKVQRTALSPFRQMFSAFDSDCFTADEIFIVGYSYGDEHINDIIRNARKSNQKTQITFINPQFDEDKIMFGYLLHWGRLKNFIFENDGEDIISRQYNVRIIKKTFNEFLHRFKR
jgi:SIR2-like domain